MRMKIEFQASKGKRIKKQFIWLELDQNSDEWFCYAYFSESREWRKLGDYKYGDTYSSSS